MSTIVASPFYSFLLLRKSKNDLRTIWFDLLLQSTKSTKQVRAFHLPKTHSPNQKRFSSPQTVPSSNHAHKCCFFVGELLYQFMNWIINRVNRTLKNIPLPLASDYTIEFHCGLLTIETKTMRAIVILIFHSWKKDQIFDSLAKFNV